MTSPSNQSSSTDLDEGLDVRSTALAFLVLALFSAVTGFVGFQVASFSLLFAGLPVSAIFTVLGGELVIAWPVDAIVWLTIASWPGRQPRLFGSRWWRAIAIAIAIALAYGAAMSMLVEPSTAFR